MSIPVQVIVAGRGLLPSVEEVQGRLGTIGGVQVVWVLAGPDAPDFAQRATAQVREMRSTRGHEGGHLQVLLAESAGELVQAAGRLPPPDADRPPWGRVALVLDEADRVAELQRLDLQAVHLIPARLPYRELPHRERERLAANLLSLLVDVARLPQARGPVLELLGQLHGVRLTLTRAVRLQAPAVQRVLARRLASRVSDRMAHALQGKDHPGGVKVGPVPDPPQADVGTALSDRARELGVKSAYRVLGEGSEPPPDEELERRARAEAQNLPSRLEDILQQHGQGMRDAALRWQGQLRQYVDDVLARDRFAALTPLLQRLQEWRETVQLEMARAGKAQSEDAASPLQDLQFEPPDSGAVRAAWDALATERDRHEDVGPLFGAWALGLTVLAVAVCHPLVETLAKTGKTLLLGDAGVGAAVLAVASLVAAVRTRLAKERLRRLEQAAERALQQWREAWTDLIARHAVDIGEVLQARLLRAADQAVAEEQAALRTVRDTVLDLRQQVQRPERGRLGGEIGDDRDLTLPEAFYAKAEQGVDPSQIFDDYEDRLAADTWRLQLEFMSQDALLRRCAQLYGAFREQLPLAQREELRELVLPPARQAVASMIQRLDDDLPPELMIDRHVALPQKLQDAVPEGGPYALRVWPSISDLFVVSTRPLFADTPL